MHFVQNHITISLAHTRSYLLCTMSEIKCMVVCIQNVIICQCLWAYSSSPKQHNIYPQDPSISFSFFLIPLHICFFWFSFHHHISICFFSLHTSLSSYFTIITERFEPLSFIPREWFPEVSCHFHEHDTLRFGNQAMPSTRFFIFFSGDKSIWYA